jgi:hypothetical protein
MGERPSEDEIRLAMALAAGRERERRVLPDRRSGIDRRRTDVPVIEDRRTGEERRRHARRAGERAPGGLLRRMRESFSRTT